MRRLAAALAVVQKRLRRNLLKPNPEKLHRIVMSGLLEDIPGILLLVSSACYSDHLLQA